jgi:phosphoenolpyruvate-protein kinase (PTS system EI component)
MSRRELRGVPASPGSAAAVVRQRPRAGTQSGRTGDAATEALRARAALASAAEEMEAVAARLREAGRAAEADIVDTSVLMARDPTLVTAIEAALATGPVSASEAIEAGCAAQAQLLASIPDPLLAARADDVRSVGRRAALLASPPLAAVPPAGEHVLIADDLGPADVADLGPDVRAIALAGGGPTAHAAIVARSLGIPMVAGLGEEILALRDGVHVVVDGEAGSVVVDPVTAELALVRAGTAQRATARSAASAARELPATTKDGHAVVVLANVAGAGEVELALEQGAEGIGLLRTELAFLDAAAWPTEADHRRALSPVLEALGPRPATVRVLDFGGDKLPPLLAGRDERGIRLLLSEPTALDAQLRAILLSAGGASVRVLVPMVEDVSELEAVATALAHAAEALGLATPPIGPMVETPLAAERAGALASRAAFLSIGTNDLTAATLGVDRFSESGAVTYHPRVLLAIAETVEAARAARIPVEVCGEAASDPFVLPLLIGLGVNEISVGAARVGTVRRWVRSLDYAQVRALADQALAAPGPEAVKARLAPIALALASLERGEAGAHGVERGGGIVAVGGQA